MYDSKSKIRKVNFSAFRVLISIPKDEREKFYGELVYKKLKVKPLEEFFKTPTINEIQKKIELDFKRLGASQTQTANQPMVVINPSVEIFYPKVAGFVNGKSFAKVRLHFTVLKNDSLVNSYAELDGVVTFLKENQKVKIELQGHTDNQGDAQKNMELSQQRVDRIKAYLVLKGIKPNRISGKGFGGTRPIAANKDEESRRLNRRVEFVIVKR